MNVYTYWEDLHDGQPCPTALLDLWSQSWRLRGWEPIVLGREDAEASPYFERMLEATAKFPTVNDRAYETANYIRYCALEQMGGGMFVDYDCINYSLYTDCMEHKMSNWPVISLGGGAFWMPIDYLRSHIERIMACTPSDHQLVINEKPHVSDMVLLMKLIPCCYADLTVVVAYKDFHWRIAQVVHYSNQMAGNLSRKKELLIQSERPV
jgi:hypothetical protein